MKRQLNVVILSIWSAWFGIVFLTNAADALKALHVLPAGFTLASGNWAFLQQVVAVHQTPSVIAALMFAGVITWELTCLVLFVRAWVRIRRDDADAEAAVTRAFMASAALWGSMMIASEIFISYAVEGTHTQLLIATLASYLVVTRKS